MKNKQVLALIEQIQRDLAKLQDQVNLLRAVAVAEDTAPEELPGGP